MRCLLLVVALFTAAAYPAAAQSSADFNIENGTLNAGGNPTRVAGAMLDSVDYRISLSSIGQWPASGVATGGGFQVSSGLPRGLRPPREVLELLFTGPATLEWESQIEAANYNLYRDLHSNLVGLGFGQCNQQGIPNNSFTDVDPIPAGDLFFYLVTAVNPLGEEGGKGIQGDGSVRAGNSCP